MGVGKKGEMGGWGEGWKGGWVKGLKSLRRRRGVGGMEGWIVELTKMA